MTQPARQRFRRHLVLAWLLAGAVLSLHLPLGPGNTVIGWSGLYWALGAPLAALLLPRSAHL